MAVFFEARWIDRAPLAPIHIELRTVPGQNANMPVIDERLIRILRRHPNIRLAILFGSRAGGDARSDSDIDLALLADEPLSGTIVLELTEAIGGEFGCPVDIVDLYHVPQPITGQVFKGIRLLGDNPDLRGVAHQAPHRQRRLPAAAAENSGGKASRMDEVIVREKLESLRRCILRVQDKTPPSPEGLADDLDVKDIVVLNLTRAIQLCVDIGNHLICGMDAAAPATMAGVIRGAWRPWRHRARNLRSDDQGRRFQKCRDPQLYSHRLRNRPCNLHPFYR